MVIIRCRTNNMLPKEECLPESVSNLVYNYCQPKKTVGRIEQLEARIYNQGGVLSRLIDRLVEDKILSLEAVGAMLGYAGKIDAGPATNFKSEPVLEYLGTGFPSDYK